MLGVVPFPEGTNHNPYPVAATGFLFGSLTTCILYGAHLSQVFRYYHRFPSDSFLYRLVLVPCVLLLSSFHIAIVVVSMYHYFVGGILDRSVWGELWWSLTVQDYLIPTMSLLAHLFFGYRVWNLAALKRRHWQVYRVLVFVVFSVGIVFSTLARLWAQDPWMPYDRFIAIKLGPAANAMPTVWFSLAATIDGCITLSLLYLLLHQSHSYAHTRDMLLQVVRLTLETVLLTHAIGATLFVLWLVSRTRSNMFWFLLEIIAETYSLSILFTLNARKKFRKASRPNSEFMMNRQLDALDGAEAQDSSQVEGTTATQSARRVSRAAQYKNPTFLDMLQLENDSAIVSVKNGQSTASHRSQHRRVQYGSDARLETVKDVADGIDDPSSSTHTPTTDADSDGLTAFLPVFAGRDGERSTERGEEGAEARIEAYGSGHSSVTNSNATLANREESPARTGAREGSKLAL